MPSDHQSPFSVKIANQQETLPVDNGLVRRAVRMVLAGEGCKAAKISVAVIDDPTIHELNKRFLNHDYPTDVLTFPLENGKKGLEGEIVVSADTAVRNAAEYKTEPGNELLLYVVHGALHLMGFDDHDEDDTAKMRVKEQFYLKKALAVDSPEVASDAPRVAQSHREAKERKPDTTDRHGSTSDRRHGGGPARGRRPRRPGT